MSDQESRATYFLQKKSLRRTLAIIVFVAVIAAAVWIGVGLQLNKNDWASWVQAVGSILAILGAWWLTDRQHHLSIAREERRRDEVKANVVEIIRQCHAMIRGIPGQQQRWEDLEIALQIVPKAHFKNLEDLLRQAPLYELGDKKVMLCAISMLEAMDRAQRLLSWIAAEPPDNRKAQWPHMASYVAQLHATSNIIISNLDVDPSGKPGTP